jgi:hypothetical protein
MEPRRWSPSLIQTLCSRRQGRRLPRTSVLARPLNRLLGFSRLPGLTCRRERGSYPDPPRLHRPDRHGEGRNHEQVPSDTSRRVPECPLTAELEPLEEPRALEAAPPASGAIRIDGGMSRSLPRSAHRCRPFDKPGGQILTRTALRDAGVRAAYAQHHQRQLAC